MKFTLRWAIEIQDENIRIEYVKGKANQVADALSRGPVVSSKYRCEQDTSAATDRILNEMIDGIIIGDRWTEILNQDDGFRKLNSWQVRNLMKLCPLRVLTLVR